MRPECSCWFCQNARYWKEQAEKPGEEEVCLHNPRAWCDKCDPTPRGEQ